MGFFENRSNTWWAAFAAIVFVVLALIWYMVRSYFELLATPTLTAWSYADGNLTLTISGITADQANSYKDKYAAFMIKGFGGVETYGQISAPSETSITIAGVAAPAKGAATSGKADSSDYLKILRYGGKTGSYFFWE